MGTREHLLAEIEEFLGRTGMGATYFGQKIGVGGNLVQRLREGKDVHTSTADQVFAFIRSHDGRRRRRSGSPPRANDSAPPVP